MAEETKKLFRSRKDKMLAGVCGGLGEFFGVDSNIIRVLFVLSALFGGAGIIIYIIIWLLVKENGKAKKSPKKSKK